MKKLFGAKLFKILLAAFGILLLSIMLVGCKNEKSHAGYYVLESIKSEGNEFGKDFIKEAELDWYIILKDDGTGTMSFSDEATDIKWGDGKLNVEGENVDYNIKNDELTFDIDGDTMVFKRSNDTPPAK